MSTFRWQRWLKGLGSKASPAKRAGKPRASVRRHRPRLEELEPRVLLDAAGERTVARLYEDLLQRPVDPVGRAAWGSLLERSVSAVQVVLGIESSPEYRTLQVQRLYGTYLHRLPEPQGLQAWLELLAAGGTMRQVRTGILGSPEYVQNRGGGSPDGFLTALYRDVLGRAVDAAGQTAFTPILVGGGSVVVADAVWHSSEATRGFVQNSYLRYLDREPDDAGFAFWVDALLRGLPEEQVVAGFAGSAEYFERFVAAPPPPLADRPAVAVPGQPGQQVTATFTLADEESGFANELGVFRVDDARGRIGALHPGDAGYAAAALAGARRLATFAPTQAPGAATSLDLPAGSFLGTYLIQNATAEAFLAGNPANELGQRPFALFSFRGANPDRHEHVRELPGGQFAFEDLFAGGDRDFNDRVVQIEFPSQPPPPPPPPSEQIKLTEGNQFRVSAERRVTVPADAAVLRFTLAEAFDTGTTDRVNDAFEAALLDDAGRSLVHTVAPGTDAFFNLSEEQPAALGAGAALDGRTVTLDLAGLPAGTEATLVLRLVNNDGDMNTAVTVSNIQALPGGSGVPVSAVVTGAARALNLPAPDFAALADVTTAFAADYGRTSFHDDEQVLTADVALRHGGSYAVDAPLLVAVANLSDPAVRVRDADGVTPEGIPYYDFSGLVADGTLSPGDLSGSRSLEFFNPGRTPFTYDLVILAQLNRAPEFTSTPDEEALVEKPYAYYVEARDVDGDALTFSLVSGPAGLEFEEATGRITWVPAREDIGTHAVTVRVEDARGGAAVQTYALTVDADVPNRPPVFTSVPTVTASLGTPYSYQASATDADGDPLSYSLPSGPRGISVDPATGLVTWANPAPQGLEWNAARDFSASQNPNGPWSYGWSQTLGSSFIRDMDNRLRDGLETWRGNLAGDGNPSIQHNGTAGPLFLAGRVRFEPGQLAFHPGPGGEYALVRWTAPRAGLYAVDTVFTALDSATTDVHAVRNGTFLFASTIDGVGSRASYTATLSLQAGDTIDFAGGYGNGSFLFDTTGLDATVTLLDRAPGASVPLNLAVSDGRGGTAQQTYVIQVEQERDNHAPVIVSTPATTALQGQAYRSDVDGIDPDEDLLTYSLDTAPTGMVIDAATGLIAWGAASQSLGQHNVSVRVEDGRGGFDMQSFVVEVSNAPPGEIRGTKFNDFNGNGNRDFLDSPPPPSPPTGNPTITLTRISTNFNGAIGIDYHEPTNSVVVSVNYSGGQPRNFEQVEFDGRHVPFSTVAGLTDEVKIATVRNGGVGGFTPGDLFVGNGVDGQIVRITDGANTVLNPWVDLPRSGNGLMRGSLYIDLTGVFGGDLIVVTTGGEVWRITSAGVPTKLADVDTHLEGLSTVPDDAARYGPLAGKILAGAEEQGRLYTIDPAGNTAFFNVGVAIEDIDLIPAHENFFGVNFGTGRILGAPASNFTALVGDILLTQENPSGSGLYRLFWDGTSLRAEQLGLASDSARVGPWEHVTFAPAGIAEISPASREPGLPDWSIYLDQNHNGRRDPGERFTTTGADGNYAFTDLTPGTYEVREELPRGNQPVPRQVVFRTDFSAGAPQFSDVTTITGVEGYAGIGTETNVFADQFLRNKTGGTPSTGVPGEKTTLTLTGLPSHTSFDLNFLLAVIDSWDGNTNKGPDFFNVTVDGNTVFRETFENAIDTAADETYKPPAGVLLTQRPYTNRGFSGGGFYNDSAYDLGLDPAFDHIPHNASTLTIEWFADGNGWEGGDDESWAIDNVEVILNNTTPGAHWVQTAPANRLHTLTVAGGQVVSQVDFGNQFTDRAFVNQPPDFASTAPTAATVCELFRYNAAATDPDDDPLQFDLPVKPLGMALDPVTGVVVWVPTADQAGPHPVLLRIQDVHGGVTLQDFTVTVTQPNTAPVITSLPPSVAVMDLPYQYQVRAQDAEGDALEFRLGTTPAGMAIDGASGLLTWTPTAAQVGSQQVTIVVRDARGAETTQGYRLAVADSAPNQPPQITSTPRSEIGLGKTYLYAVQASDPDGDPHSFHLDTAPAGMAVDAAGLITWEPTAAQFGPNAVQVRVDDGPGGSHVQEFTVHVLTQDTNQPPAITSAAALTGTAGQLYRYDVAANDPDGDPLGYTLDQAPAGMSIDSSRGTIRWIPATCQMGTNDVVLRVVDAQGGQVVQRFTITVEGVNITPIITSEPPTRGYTGVSYTYPLRAVDLEGNPLTFSLTSAPAGMTIAADTGLIAWTPQPTQLGNFAVVVQVDDGRSGIAKQSYTLVVTDTPHNRPPIITSAPPLRAVVNQLYRYAVSAVDPEGGGLLYSLRDPLPGMSIDASGLLQWTPTGTQPGPAAVHVVVMDADRAVGAQDFTVIVTTGNRAPAIVSSPVGTATAGLVYHYDVQATDLDGDPLTFTLAGDTRGLTVDQFGRISGPVTTGDVGVHPIRVTVADGRGGSFTQSYELTVTADTETPRVALLFSANPVNVGTAASARVLASDNVGVQALGLSVGGVPVALDANGRATLPTDRAGDFDVVATATDAAGNTTRATLLFGVLDPSDVNAPVVAFLTPDDDAVITGPTDVIGTANDDNLVFYKLEVASISSGRFTEFARGTAPVVNGVLGRFDPSLLPNDTYILRLTAQDAGGNIAFVDRIVSVAGDLKLGNFTLSFTDLTVPVSGIPITVARTYDTLTADRENDLGFGWRLEFRDVDLRTSVPRTGAEEDGLYNPFREGSRVYVTLPGGKREGFTFRPRGQSININFFYPLTIYHPEFVADAGVTSKLTVPNFTLLRQGNQYFGFAFSDLPYNPADSSFGGRYTVTTRDGLVYDIDATEGKLRSVADPNGNRLTFSDAGIVSSAGPRVTFGRDARGRITSVTDPMGKQVHYQFDGNGDLVAVIDRSDNVTRFVYSTARPHYLQEVIDALGRTGARIEYDDKGRMVRLINGAGQAVQFTHDPTDSRETVLDARGNPTTYGYDDRGNVVTEVDALGGVTQRTYDLDNNLLTETDRLHNTVVRTYDAAGRVLTRTDPLGNVTRYRYDDHGNVLSATDPLGNTFANTFDRGGNLLTTRDAEGNLVSTITYNLPDHRVTAGDALGNITTYQHDAAGRLLDGTNALGNTVRYTYDANGRPSGQQTTRTESAGNPVAMAIQYVLDDDGRLERATDPDGTGVGVENDALGRQSAVSDRLGNRIRYEFDAAGNPVATNYPDGTTERTTYDANRNLVSFTDRVGRTTRHEYDALNRRVRTTFPDGASTTMEYDAAGQLIARTDENGSRTTFVYDAAGRQTHVTDSLGNSTVSAYDAAGLLVGVTDPLGRTTRFEYDANGSRIRVVYPDGTSVSTAYDRRGLKVAETDQLGNATRFEYDALGRLVKVIDALGNATRCEYDELGNKVAQTDTNGHTTRWAYDDRGHVIRQTLPLGMSETFTYDANGLQASHLDFSGRLSTSSYDAGSRLTAERYAGQSEVRYTYTPGGRRQTATDARGVTRYSYDARDRLTQVEHPDGTAVAYAYDSAGSVTSVTTPSGTTASTYDARSLLQTVTDPDGGVTTYVYDAAGNLVRTNLPDGTVEMRRYDDVGRLVSVQTADAAGNLLTSHVYRLSASGARLAVEEGAGRRVEYTFDALSRLLRESTTDPVAGNRVTEYTYDAVGNRLTRNDSLDGLTTYRYDENDRLVAETHAGTETRYSYDADGHLLAREGAGGLTAYQWGAANRLVAADTDGDGTPDVRYQYDVDGVRVVQAVGGVETQFLVDGNRPWAQVLEERTAAGVVQTSYAYGHSLLSRETDAGRLYYHGDGLGSVRLLTGPSGETVDRFTYDAFGNLQGAPGASANTFLFAGEQFDPALEAYYLRARYYDPATGRFSARDLFPGDPQNPQGLHRYVYAQNDPVDRIDPSGQFSLLQVAATATIVSFLTSLAVGNYTTYVQRNLSAEDFLRAPDAALVGFSGTIPVAQLSTSAGLGAPLPVQVAVELASLFIQLFVGVEFVFPFRDPTLIWPYAVPGANFNILPGSTFSAGVYTGLAWNVPDQQAYAGLFLSRTTSVGPLSGSIFSGLDGPKGSYGFSVGFSVGAGRPLFNPFPTNISSSVSYYVALPAIQVPGPVSATAFLPALLEEFRPA